MSALIATIRLVEMAPLEERHALLIKVVADALARCSAWPRYDYVDAILDHEHGVVIADALADLPREFAWPQSGHSPQSLIVATVAGLAGHETVRPISIASSRSLRTPLKRSERSYRRPPTTPS